MAVSEYAPLLEAKLPHDAGAPFTRACRDKSGRQLPQCMAHRGHTAEYPENTMGAFKSAFAVGAHAIETDIHLSKDGVVVLSHDGTLKRCFGLDQKIIDCDWDYLSELRTVKEPHESMPRLSDLLEYLASPGLGEIWLLLDIKIDNDANDVMRLIADTIESVPTSSSRPWSSRIVLGCWATKFLPLCAKYLPSFSITHIGSSTCYARRFLKLAPPQTSLNMLQKILVPPAGRRLLRECQADGRAVFVWTVNEPSMMRWSIRHRVDGVLTDDLKTYLEVCQKWKDGPSELEGREFLTVRQIVGVLGINLMALVFGILFRWRHGDGLLDEHAKAVRKGLEGLQQQRVLTGKEDRRKRLALDTSARTDEHDGHTVAVAVETQLEKVGMDI